MSDDTPTGIPLKPFGDGDTDGAGGRDARGRFAAGNAGGPGNPHAAAVAKMRAAMLAAITDDDIREVVRMLVDRAKRGNIQAARELLDRCCGRAGGGPDDWAEDQTPKVVRYIID
jgi:hypothetical protein